jgi:hypothetical protein
MRISENKQKSKSNADRRPQGTGKAVGGRGYTRLSERGLGPQGGGWNVLQAAHWAGLSEAHLRNLIQRAEAGEEGVCFPFHRCGRRLIVPREGFIRWFNKAAEGSAA